MMLRRCLNINVEPYAKSSSKGSSIRPLQGPHDQPLTPGFHPDISIDIVRDWGHIAQAVLLAQFVGDGFGRPPRAHPHCRARRWCRGKKCFAPVSALSVWSKPVSTPSIVSGGGPPPTTKDLPKGLLAIRARRLRLPMPMAYTRTPEFLMALRVSSRDARL